MVINESTRPSPTLVDILTKLADQLICTKIMLNLMQERDDYFNVFFVSNSSKRPNVLS